MLCKKRHHYGTVLVYLLSHRIIDLIDSKNIPEVSKWLENYPNITVFSRDGSSSYKRAIAGAHPDAIQVSDRFHLIQKLTDRIKQYLMIHLPISVSVKDFVEIEKPSLHLTKGEENRLLLFEEKIRRTQELIQNGWKYVENSTWILNHMTKLFRNPIVLLLQKPKKTFRYGTSKRKINLRSRPDSKIRVLSFCHC